MKLRLILLNCFLLLSVLGQGQQKMDIKPFVQLGYIVGGSITSNNFNYASGGQFQLGLMKSLNDQIEFGISGGMENYDQNYFYPLGLRLEAKLFKNENFRYIFSTGYAFAEYRQDSEIDNFELNGGVFVDAGRMWLLNISDKIDLMTQFSLRYQFAELENQIGTHDFSEKTDYFRGGLSIGIRFK